MVNHSVNQSINQSVNPEVMALAKQLWEYHHLNHSLEKAECILALGSHDLRVAERAAELYLEGWAPGKKLLVTSPQIAFEDYPTEEILIEQVIQVMTGDLQRIRLYPAKGFQIEQHIPDSVWQAYEQLIALGFNKHLVT